MRINKKNGARPVLIVLFLLLSGCDRHSHKAPSLPNKFSHTSPVVQVEATTGRKLLPPITVVSLQRGMAQLQRGKVQLPKASSLQHTTFVGTADNPTLDGGIINSVDGLPVSSQRFSASSLPAFTATNKSRNNFLAEGGANTPNLTSSDAIQFQDKWATSARVKEMLAIAAHKGRLDYVLRKLDEKNLPASIATVPMIESNYRESAISDKGAAGAWQLMPRTAQDYGLEKYGGYNFAAATEAALNLLTDLYRRFNSWELAFAAYNAGTGRVQDALRKNPTANSVQELDLPQETKNYVARIMALNKALDRGEV